MKKLRKEGFIVGRYRVRQLMEKLNLVVTQRLAHKVTIHRKHSDAVADNLLNMNFNPVAPNQVWVGDVTYLLKLRSRQLSQPVQGCFQPSQIYFCPELKVVQL